MSLASWKRARPNLLSAAPELFGCVTEESGRLFASADRLGAASFYGAALLPSKRWAKVVVFAANVSTLSFSLSNNIVGL